MAKSNDPTSSAEVFHVKTSVWQDQEPGSTDRNPACGGDLPESSAFFDRKSSSWKTWQRSLFGGWEPLLGNFPASGMTRRGHLYALPTLERPISEGECSLWPTPVATDSKDVAAANYSTASGRHGVTLLDTVRAHHGHLDEKTTLRGDDGIVVRPEFVEALMGLPEGWTHVDDDLASAALETPLSRDKQPKR